MDIREKTAKYYDLWTLPFDDVPFYINRIPSIKSSILELGCGTGRVLTRLVNHCAFIHGIDISPAMIDICRKKNLKLNNDHAKVAIETGDITDFSLGRKFDLIIAPYRVFQNIETNDQIDGFFQCIRNHLAFNGSCILNVFQPWPVERIRESWGGDKEIFCWEAPFDGGYVTCHERKQHFDDQKLILYPETIYRFYAKDKLFETTTQKICMRLYYPENFEKIIQEKGFSVIERWGGYEGEPYCKGNELIIRFKDGVQPTNALDPQS